MGTGPERGDGLEHRSAMMRRTVGRCASRWLSRWLSRRRTPISTIWRRLAAVR